MKNRFLEGIVKRHPDGFGFMIPDDTSHPDVFIPRHSMNGVMTNDRVMAQVEKDRGENRYRGEIVRVTKRFFTQALGKFHDNAGGGILNDDGHGWGEPLKIKAGQTLNAKSGDFVKVEIISYPNQKDGLCGKVIEILGKHSDPLLDVKKVIFQQKIPDQFSEACVQEAESMPREVRKEDMQGRRDLTQKQLVTIDGVTAKDFDDAVYVEQESRGFRVWVAIADVSHYVKPGRPMDIDAYERGNSTYFPNYVVPMLPEALSNELCSLKPHVIRLSLVSEMLLDFTGELVEYEFYEAYIKSHARVTYGEAQEIIDGNCPEKLMHVKEAVLRASDVAKILLARRMKLGSLQLEIPETQVILNDLGEPIDMIRAERVFAHKVIEELMLIANVATAKFLDKHEIPALYRIHEPPRQEAIDMLNKYLLAFGAKRQVLGSQNLAKNLTQALVTMQDTPQEEILNILTLRSMNQAQYSADNVGHFGLGFEHYTHFTSPIRRYPDLIVHRLIKSLILKSDQYRAIPDEDLRSAGTHLSACEQRSAKCERQFYAIKKARFMVPHIGSEFDGVISSVTKFGVFVLLREYDVDGLVKLDELGDDHFEFDEDNLRLVAKRSGLAYEIGMPLKILVANVDVDGGRIDFALAETEEKPAGRLERLRREKSRDEKPRDDRPREQRKFTSSDRGYERPQFGKAKHEKKKKKSFKGDNQRRREDNGETAQHGKANRTHDKKRGETANDSRGVRKARVRKRR